MISIDETISTITALFYMKRRQSEHMISPLRNSALQEHVTHASPLKQVIYCHNVEMFKSINRPQGAEKCSRCRLGNILCMSGADFLLFLLFRLEN